MLLLALFPALLEALLLELLGRQITDARAGAPRLPDGVVFYLRWEHDASLKFDGGVYSNPNRLPGIRDADTNLSQYCKRMCYIRLTLGYMGLCAYRESRRAGGIG